MRLKILILSFVLALTACTDRDPNYTVEIQGEVIENSGRDGCPDVLYPNWKTSRYVLPYPVGKSYQVDLSNCSLFNHAPGEIDQFAVDFLMPIGSDITASREGVVAFVEEDNEDFSNATNIIVIRHADNTYAQYTSLTKDGALADVGELVVKGQVIAKSGATGFSTYPHIHFIVTKDGFLPPYEGIPITFSNTSPNPLGLDSFTTYTSFVY